MQKRNETRFIKQDVSEAKNVIMDSIQKEHFLKECDLKKGSFM